MGNKKLVGVAFTAAARKRKALQDTVASHGVNPERLTYIEHEASRTARVEDADGRVLERFGW